MCPPSCGPSACSAGCVVCKDHTYIGLQGSFGSCSFPNKPLFSGLQVNMQGDATLYAGVAKTFYQCSAYTAEPNGAPFPPPTPPAPSEPPGFTLGAQCQTLQARAPSV